MSSNKISIFLIIYTVLVILNQKAIGDILFRNKNGFVNCVEKSDQVLFLEWDQFSLLTNKPIYYFNLKDYVKVTGHKIKNCSQQKQLLKIPNQILKSVFLTQDLFSEEVLFSAKQVSNGATLFRKEVTEDEFIKNQSQYFKLNAVSKIEQLEQFFGDKFTEKTIETWSKNLFGVDKNCEKYIGSCDFYLCQDSKNPCGLKGYNLGFGFKYCSLSKFSLGPQMSTEDGKKWVSTTFQCLQNYSAQVSSKNPKNTCNQIQLAAYGSHPECYVNSGFCKLKFYEKFKIIKLLKKDLFTAQTFLQARDVIHRCMLKKEEKDKLINELHELNLR